jgi:hypothetical protein
VDTAFWYFIVGAVVLVQARFQAKSQLCLPLQQDVTSLPYIRYQVLITWITKHLTSGIYTVWSLTVCGVLSPYLNVLGSDLFQFHVVEVLLTFYLKTK